MCGILLPGRLSRFREAPLTEVAAITVCVFFFSSHSCRKELLIREAGPVFSTPSLPFMFLGHSMGTVIVCVTLASYSKFAQAYEFMLALRRRGWTMPLHLLVSGRYAPHLPPIDSKISHLPDAQFLDTLEKVRFLCDVSFSAISVLPFSLELHLIFLNISFFPVH